jgi:signal recognition particle receptor subunit beta
MIAQVTALLHGVLPSLASGGRRMVLFNYATKEITAKIVYYGPGLCGKTTNLQFVYESLPSNNKSKMLSLATKTDRTLFFDFLPLDLGKIRGMRTKLQLYTVPGQVYYNSTRQLVLKGADGIVFVADSQDFAVEANQESLQNLEDNLKRQGIRIKEIPVVLQYNKRDLPNAMPAAELDKRLNRLNAPHFQSVATTGIGVEATLKGITKLVIAHLVKKYGLEGSEPLDKEIQILNANTTIEVSTADSLWEEPDDATLPLNRTAGAPEGEQEFELDDASGHEQAPLVATELIGSRQPGLSARGPFDNDYFSTSGPPAQTPQEIHVPVTSVEIALPKGIMESLPQLDSGGVGVPASVPPPAAAERRANDSFVKEVNIPLNLSISELREHRRLRLKITLDVNLLP